jgi:hypothetical protein
MKGDAKMKTQAIIMLAERNLNNGAAMASSARLCYTSAIEALCEGQPTRAEQWAFQSLAYSVGVFHEDCAAVGKAIGHKFFIESKPTRDHNPCVDTSYLNR